MGMFVGRILVPVDFSLCSRAALDYAAMLAERLVSTIDVLYVWEPPDTAEDTVLAAFAKTEAGHKMGELLSLLEERRIVEVRGRVESGDPAKTICNVAPAYDLIIMGTHGRSGLSHALRGGVAERVVRHASCPVLTIRSDDRTTVRAGASA